jgi:hypothetical protein
MSLWDMDSINGINDIRIKMISVITKLFEHYSGKLVHYASHLLDLRNSFEFKQLRHFMQLKISNLPGPQLNKLVTKVENDIFFEEILEIGKDPKFPTKDKFNYWFHSYSTLFNNLATYKHLILKYAYAYLKLNPLRLPPTTPFEGDEGKETLEGVYQTPVKPKSIPLEQNVPPKKGRDIGGRMGWEDKEVEEISYPQMVLNFDNSPVNNIQPGEWLVNTDFRYIEDIYDESNTDKNRDLMGEIFMLNKKYI